MKRCSNCGTPVKKGETHCPYCGKQQGLRKGILPLIIMFILLVIALLLLFVGIRSLVAQHNGEPGAPSGNKAPFGQETENKETAYKETGPMSRFSTS